MQVVLDGLNNMLKVAASHVEEVANLIEECEGLAKIERLQSHENVEIYKLAYEIIEKYFTEVSVQIICSYMNYNISLCNNSHRVNKLTWHRPPMAQNTILIRIMTNYQ